MSLTFTAVFLFIYLSGRLFFYDTSMLINGGKSRGYLLRILYAGFVFIFLENIFLAAFVFITHALLVLFDTFFRTRREHLRLSFYFIHLLVVFILIICLSFISFSSLHYSNPLFFLPELPAKWLVRIQNFLLVTAGFIFTIKESTIIIRMVLLKARAVPMKKETPNVNDIQEFNRGKLIGILERGLIFFMILFNQVAAIAIIIGLKSIARFKEIDDKEFAEYFLIGSLLSIVTAVIPAVCIKFLLST